MECDSNMCIFLICESIFFNHGSVLQQKDIKMLRENQRQILKIASIATSVDGPIATGAVSARLPRLERDFCLLYGCVSS
jgi:hypothetical protein